MVEVREKEARYAVCLCDRGKRVKHVYERKQARKKNRKMREKWQEGRHLGQTGPGGAADRKNHSCHLLLTQHATFPFLLTPPLPAAHMVSFVVRGRFAVPCLILNVLFVHFATCIAVLTSQ